MTESREEFRERIGRSTRSRSCSGELHAESDARIDEKAMDVPRHASRDRMTTRRRVPKPSTPPRCGT